MAAFVVATNESFLILLLLLSNVASSPAQCIPTSKSPRIEIFSTVKAVANQGEAGSALRLEETGRLVSATLRDHWGGGKVCKTYLTGTLTETQNGACMVHLSGKNEDGLVKIDGEIEITRFRGTATRQIGEKIYSHVISLRRQLPSELPEIGLLVHGHSNSSSFPHAR